MTSIKDCVDKYLSTTRILGNKTTARKYGCCLRRWMDWLDAGAVKGNDGTPITRNSDIAAANTWEVAASWYKHIVERRRKPDGSNLNSNTARGYGHALRALFNFCCKSEFWTPEPAPLNKSAVQMVSMPKHVDNHREPVTVDTLLKILDACDRLPSERERRLAYAVMQCFLVSGIRHDELVHLEMTDYDPKKRTLSVRFAKGGKPRVQVLDPACCEAIDAWLGVRPKFVRGRWEQLPSRAWRHTADLSGPDYLFVKSAKRHLTYNSVSKLFAAVCQAAGLEPDAARPHQIRHLQTTRIYQSSGLRAAQRFCGHTSEKTTWRYIRQTTNTEMEEALATVQLRPVTVGAGNNPIAKRKNVQRARVNAHFQRQGFAGRWGKPQTTS